MIRTGARGKRGPGGSITGQVLKLARNSAGLSQEALAEALEVSLDTIQGWESGRRSLAATRVAMLAGIRHVLVAAKADPRVTAALDSAVEADWVIEQTLELEGRHPFAGWVTTYEIHAMLLWALIGNPPPWLAAEPGGAGNGLARPSPILDVPQRGLVFARLRDLAERADGRNIAGLQLRRQAAFLARYDPAADTATWIEQLPETRYSGGGWSPEWVAARSRVISQAGSGDPEPLRWFIEHALAGDDQLESAQLAWNAYYYGELVNPQHSDSFMIGAVPSWPGEKVLTWLVGRLDPSCKYVDLIAHTLWVLLGARPQLATSSAAAGLVPKIESLLDSNAVSARSRRELGEAGYLLRALSSKGS